MITQTIINNLKSSSALLTLLDVTTANAAYIQTFYNPLSAPAKSIIVSYTFGETVDNVGYEFGTVTVEVLVNDSVGNPVNVMNSITLKILSILDLKGSQLNDAYTSIVYILRKTDVTHMYDNKLHCHIASIDFSFYCDR